METKPLKTLLFVDDDQDILTIAKYALQSLKEIQISFVSSGEEAISKAKEIEPDLILLDVMMPKMDGIMTLNAMKQIPELKKIPIVFFTAKVTKEEISSYHHMGVIDVLTKPFDPIKLGSMILQIWREYQLKTEIH